MKSEIATGSRCFLGLGSNIEPREGYLASAIKAIQTLGKIAKISSIYETAPVGGVPQPDYLNAVVEFHTPVGPIELASRLKALEKALGRTARPKWHEREIDLDLLFYDGLILHDSPELEIPHPEIARRAFVLVPMAELDPEFVHPVLNRTMKDLREQVGTQGVRRTDIVI